MKNFITFFVLFISFFSFSQKESAWWVFGDGAAIEFTDTGIQNRSNNTNIVTSNFNTDEGCSSISDSQGNLLFFTDGSSIFDRNGSIMPNGSGLTGNTSSTQSAMIVEAPHGNGVYFIFTVGGSGNGPLAYSRLEMQLNSGLGDIVPGVKNIVLLNSCSEKLSGIKKQNSNNVYITTFAENDVTPTQSGTGDFNSLYTYEIIDVGTNSYVSPTAVPQINNSNSNRFESTIFATSRDRGQLKFSPNGNYVALANQGFSSTSSTDHGAYLLKFDNVNGQFIGPILTLENQGCYGLEFSIDSNYLYYDISEAFSPASTTTRTIIQYDISDPSNILNTRNVISFESSFAARGSLQLGMDGEIYSVELNNSFIGRINNSRTAAASYTKQFFNISPGLAQQGLPNILPSTILSNYTLSNQTVNTSEIQIFPNPTSDYLGITASEELESVEIFNMDGKSVLSKSLQTNSAHIDLTDLFPGLHIVKVHNLTGSTQVFKVIKK
ncbi:T9SS type A sorting domain-containing protein [Nonlabens ulvanivorans]|uniref:T9SS type A sorting domain-containing protein n=1 Tax=Nonlabens ulvanivorans TaxID=906888 RepID=UPI00294214E9|nr:T9SS type A sorting domain-containing protein [Nonlabens ulvanivorans]WOI23893.1 T9SS type A sorting domain-containing protein [Nonlabens ulvanivorans]